MRSLPAVVKDYVIQTTRYRMEQWWNEQPDNVRGPLGSYCLWWVWHLTCVLRGMDIPAQIQAGTAYWPRLREDQDDGLPTTKTQYGYKFTDCAANVVQIVILHQMPEMHAWVGIPGVEGFPPTIIDATTQWWPELCKLRTGMDWPGDNPPPYFWSDKVPHGVMYAPHREAIKLCYQVFYLTGTLKEKL